MKRSEIYFSVALIPLDFLALLVGFVGAYYLKDTPLPFGLSHGEGPVQSFVGTDISGGETLSAYLGAVVLAILVILLCFTALGLYAIRTSDSFGKRFVKVVFGVTGGEFAMMLLAMDGGRGVPYASVVYGWVLGILAIVLVRQLIFILQRFMRRYNVGVVQVGVIGTNEIAKQVTRALQGHSAYRVVAQAGVDKIDDTLKLFDEMRLDEIVVANEQLSVEDLIRLRNYCLECHVGFSFVPNLLMALGDSSFAPRAEGGVTLIEVRPTPLDGWGRVLKRALDIIGSCVLMALFSPLYLVIFLIMKISSPGPAIFLHPRIGRNGKTIFVRKFRSMNFDWCDTDGQLAPPFRAYLDSHPEAAAEWKETQKLRDDPRISRIGKILRNTRLDELPQFYDVLIGSLSLVGPRPIIRDEIERFGEKARTLFTVRPGVTGLWQVEGGNDLSYDQRVVLNSYYIEHWSPWLDLVILSKTAWLVFGDIVSKLLGKKKEGGAY